MDIEADLIRFNDSELPEHFVSLAAQIVNNEAKHSAILIRYQNVHYLHHFPGGSPPELGTCVGFCVNTLNNTILDAESYFHIDDWDDSGMVEWVDGWSQREVSGIVGFLGNGVLGMLLFC